MNLMQISRRGASVTSVLMTFVGAGLLGAAAYSLTSGHTICSLTGSCDHKATDATVVAAADASESTCGGCPLSGKAQTIAASTDAGSEKGYTCSSKSDCGPKTTAAETIAASTDARPPAKDCSSTCGSKAQAIAASDCGAKPEVAGQVIAASTESASAHANCASTCGSKAKAIAAADTGKVCPVTGASAGQVIAAASEAADKVSCAAMCPVTAKKQINAMLAPAMAMTSSMTPVIVPASFYTAGVELDRASLADAKTCGSSCEKTSKASCESKADCSSKSECSKSSCDGEKATEAEQASEPVAIAN